MSLVKLKNITKVYGKSDYAVNALNGVSLEIEKGEMLAIMGASGSGKSTLLNIIGCIDKPSGGQYWLDDANVSTFGQKELAKTRNEKFGFVVQDFALVERYNVIKNVLIPLSYSTKKVSKSNVDLVLEKLGILEKKHTLSSHLSGGQRQRVAIARAIVNEPDIILADEPTGSLDRSTGFEVIDIFKQLNNEGKTVIIITHDNNVAEKCKRIIYIDDGIIRC